MGDATAYSMSPLFRNGTFPARQAITAESESLYRQQTYVLFSTWMELPLV